MQTWYEANLTLHIMAGTVGLVSMFVPMIARKGSRVHRRAGWVFVVAMAMVALSGLGIAAAWLTVPLQARPPERPLSPEQLDRYASSLRTMGVFFGFIGVIVAGSMWQGLVALWQRRDAIAWGNPIDRGFAWATLVLGVVLLVVGGIHWNPVVFGFGVFGVVGGVGDLRFYARKDRPKNTWLLRHLQAMLGGATAATTAFTVQAVGRVLSESGNGQWLMLAWGLPPVLGTLLAYRWSRRVANKSSRYTSAQAS